MPLYDYECTHCHHCFEDYRKIADREFTSCPNCLDLARQVMSAPKLDLFQPFWHEDMGHEPVYIKSRQHYKEECKKNGVYAPHVFGQGWNLSEI